MKLRMLSFFLVAGTLIVNAQAPVNAWKLSLGGTFPRLISGDIYPDDFNYGGFLALQRDYSEHVGLRLGFQALSMTADNPDFPAYAKRVRTNMASANADVLYRLSPCEAVVPYISAGLGGYFFALETKLPIAKKLKDGDVDFQFNLGFGAEWKLNNTLAIVTDLGYHTAATSRLDGFRGTSGGFLGTRNDAYMTFSVGFSFTLSQGERSHLNDAYTGIKFPEPERVDYAKIESMIKANVPPAEKVDYPRIEEMIRSNKPVIKQQPERVIIQKNAPVAFENINFASGSARLDKEAINSLNRAVAILNDNTDLVVELEGHTDNVGSAVLNKKLSEQRAEAVKKYLRTRGISDARLSVTGLETANPVGDNTTAEGRAMNRRVELKILKK